MINIIKIDKKFYKKLIEIIILIFILCLSDFFINIKNNKKILLNTTNSETVYILPEENSEVYNFIYNATSSIDITVYMLSDKNIKNKLIEKNKNGLNINIILEKTPFGGGNINYKTYNELSSYGINIKYSNPEFSLTHAKYIIIDKKEALIMTSNLTYSGLNKDRDFAIYEDDQEIINNLVYLFDKDFNYKKYKNENENLIVSPTNSRTKIESIIKSANSDIKMYIENINDNGILNILIKKMKDGVSLKIVGPDSKKIESNSEYLDKLKLNGAEIKYLKNPYQHAKMLMIDEKIMYLGSINFSRQSLDENREVGIITINKNSIKKVLNTFNTDFYNN